MKKILFLIVISLFSCQKDKKRIDSNKQNSINLNLWTLESINPDSVLINGQLKVFASKSDVFSMFGTPNDICNLGNEAFLTHLLNERENDVANRYLYDNIEFEGINDKLVLKAINITDELFLVTPDIIFENNFDYKTFEQLYPESNKLILYDGSNAWTGHIELRVAKKGLARKMRWFILFRDAQVARIEFHRFL